MENEEYRIQREREGERERERERPRPKKKREKEEGIQGKKSEEEENGIWPFFSSQISSHFGGSISCLRTPKKGNENLHQHFNEAFFFPSVFDRLG